MRLWKQVAAIALMASSCAFGQEANPADYIVTIDWTRIVRLSGHRTCLQVIANGGYRLEEFPEPFKNPSSAEVYEGTLAQPQLDRLRYVLAESEFASLPNSEITQPGYLTNISDGDMVQILVPRPTRKQVLRYFNDEKHVNMPKTVHPLLDWVKVVRKAKGNRLKGQSPSLCRPMEMRQFP